MTREAIQTTPLKTRQPLIGWDSVLNAVCPDCNKVQYWADGHGAEAEWCNSCLGRLERFMPRRLARFVPRRVTRLGSTKQYFRSVRV